MDFCSVYLPSRVILVVLGKHYPIINVRAPLLKSTKNSNLMEDNLHVKLSPSTKFLKACLLARQYT